MSFSSRVEQLLEQGTLLDARIRTLDLALDKHLPAAASSMTSSQKKLVTHFPLLTQQEEQARRPHSLQREQSPRREELSVELTAEASPNSGGTLANTTEGTPSEATEENESGIERSSEAHGVQTQGPSAVGKTSPGEKKAEQKPSASPSLPVQHISFLRDQLSLLDSARCKEYLHDAQQEIDNKREAAERKQSEERKSQENTESKEKNASEEVCEEASFPQRECQPVTQEHVESEPLSFLAHVKLQTEEEVLNSSSVEKPKEVGSVVVGVAVEEKPQGEAKDLEPNGAVAAATAAAAAASSPEPLSGKERALERKPGSVSASQVPAKDTRETMDHEKASVKGTGVLGTTAPPTPAGRVPTAPSTNTSLAAAQQAAVTVAATPSPAPKNPAAAPQKQPSPAAARAPPAAVQTATRPTKTRSDFENEALEQLDKGIWKATRDGKGRKYYYNKREKKSCWDLVRELEKRYQESLNGK